jgi:C4-dicarboxylate-specific signal transduction histidine kinase
VSSLLGIANLSRVPRGQFFELCLVNNRGEKRSVNYIVYKLQNKSVSYEDNDFIISIRDIEDIKQNEEIIVSQREQLFEASKLSALGEMASGFAHEINNPLAIIKGRLAITERGIKKEEMSKEAILKNLEICKTTVERITKIIVGLRNLAHGSSSSESEEVAIKNLVEDPIIMAILKMSGKGIDFSTDIKSVEEELVVCNRIQISQVLMNILGNAIDAVEGQESPWIKLSVEASDSQVKFNVIDSGKGIPLDVQKRMFNPMYTTKSVGKGTGLGLSISRAIVEKHNGRIQLNNESPNTCFEIILPRATVSKQFAA